MASKQLGKFRQWTGEKLSRGPKQTTLTDDFKELESDVALRGAGVERLILVSDAYIHAMAKKKEIEADASSGKLLPVEALGLVMIVHGDEFGNESIYGQSLVKFGRAHCKIAALQEDYATAVQDSFHQSLLNHNETIKEYAAQRKKLDSRRLAYDATMARLAKTKKEKEKAEIEEEVDIARIRYEEMSEDVQDRMFNIKQSETQQLAELTEFLETELAFVNEYHALLSQLKLEWPNVSSIRSQGAVRPRGAAHTFTPHEVRSPSPPTASIIPSLIKSASFKRPKPTSSDAPTPPPRPRSRANTATAPVPPSNRKRSDSVATTGSAGGDLDQDTSTTPSKRRGVSGWMGSVRSKRAGSVRSKKGFGTLDDESDQHRSDESEGDTTKYGHNKSASSSRPTITGTHSSSSSSTRSAVPPPLPPPRRRATVRAIFDFSSTSVDELAFRKGDELVLLEDPPKSGSSDGWVRAEMKGSGNTGLIPLNYTEEVAAPVPPPLPSRFVTGSKPLTPASSYNSENEEDFHVPSSRPRSSTITRTQSQLQSRYDDAEPFGDHHRTSFNSDTGLTTDEDEYHHSDEDSDQDQDILLGAHINGDDSSPVPNGYYHNANAATTSSSSLGSSSIHRTAAGTAAHHHAGSFSSSNSNGNSSSTMGGGARAQLASILGRKAPPPPPARRTTTAAGVNGGTDSSTAASNGRPALPARTRSLRETKTQSPFGGE